MEEKTEHKHLEIFDLELMVIPKRYYFATIDSIEDKKVKATLEKFVENVAGNVLPGAGLCLTGGMSNGKTYAACALLKRLRGVIPGFKGMFVDVACVNEDFLKREFMEEGIRICDRMMDVDVLVLDDVGGEKKFEKEKIFDIFKKRWNDLKRTVITSNLDTKTQYVSSFEPLGEKFWQLVEGCCLIVPFPKRNMRAVERDMIKENMGKK